MTAKNPGTVCAERRGRPTSEWGSYLLRLLQVGGWHSATELWQRVVVRYPDLTEHSVHLALRHYERTGHVCRRAEDRRYCYAGNPAVDMTPPQRGTSAFTLERIW